MARRGFTCAKEEAEVLDGSSLRELLKKIAAERGYSEEEALAMVEQAIGLDDREGLGEIEGVSRNGLDDSSLVELLKKIAEARSKGECSEEEALKMAKRAATLNDQEGLGKIEVVTRSDQEE